MPFLPSEWNILEAMVNGGMYQVLKKVLDNFVIFVYIDKKFCLVFSNKFGSVFQC